MARRTAAGTKLTRKVVRELADEAERGYDLADAHIEYPRRGRPSLTASGERSPQITVRITPDLRDRAADRAAAEGKTVSEITRDALESYLVP